MLVRALVEAYADDDAVRNQSLEWDTHFGGSGCDDIIQCPQRLFVVSKGQLRLN
jgi:hypothetical protein